MHRQFGHELTWIYLDLCGFTIGFTWIYVNLIEFTGLTWIYVNLNEIMKWMVLFINNKLLLICPESFVPKPVYLIIFWSRLTTHVSFNILESFLFIKLIQSANQCQSLDMKFKDVFFLWHFQTVFHIFFLPLERILAFFSPLIILIRLYIKHSFIFWDLSILLENKIVTQFIWKKKRKEVKRKQIPFYTYTYPSIIYLFICKQRFSNRHKNNKMYFILSFFPEFWCIIFKFNLLIFAKKKHRYCFSFIL